MCFAYVTKSNCVPIFSLIQPGLEDNVFEVLVLVSVEGGGECPTINIRHCLDVSEHVVGIEWVVGWGTRHRRDKGVGEVMV